MAAGVPPAVSLSWDLDDVAQHSIALCFPIYGHGPIMYLSDITRFLEELKQNNPQLEQEQSQGRALLWDKSPLDMDETRRNEASRVKQSAYVYYQNP